MKDRPVSHITFAKFKNGILFSIWHCSATNSNCNVFGDSLLAGYIDGHATNIVTQGLQEKLPNFTIINNSVPGSTTEEAIDFYDLRIKPFNYDLVILALGTNDANMQFGLSAGRYAHNLQVLVDLIGVDKTILMGPSYTNWKIAKDQAWPKTLQLWSLIG